ncbi:MAG TPA: LysR family transcriptional regulator [Candidatus Udaeobacter sp.]|nr:LysR family transcriptional regulator [Candidatus Udaeobacter sp.]
MIAFVRAATFSQCILGMDDMREAHLRDVDLNLLRTIQPLLEERHISRAAQRAFLSQPAMSRALNRLRETFGDPLLVRSNGVYERTPRGERVLREIETIMRRLETIVHDQQFSPEQSRERFRVAMTDHGSTILLPKLLERLRKEAPQSELVLSAVGPQTFDEVSAGRIDLNLCAEEVPPALENEIIFNLDFVCLVGARQRMMNRRLTLKQYLRLPHAMILTGDGHQAMIDRPLAALGAKRRIALRIPFFIPAVFAIAKTDLVLTVPRTLARIAAPKAGLRIIKPPRELKPFPYFMSWHPRLTNEAAHAWLREQVRAVARSIRSK